MISIDGYTSLCSKLSCSIADMSMLITEFVKMRNEIKALEKRVFYLELQVDALLVDPQTQVICL